MNHNQIQHEVDALTKIERKAFKSRDRFKERRYLLAVYKLRQKCWQTGTAGKVRKQLVSMYSLKGTAARGSLLRAIMDCTSQATPKIKSRWMMALRAAIKRKIAPKHLDGFFDKHRGVAGAARLVARPRKLTAKKRGKKYRWGPPRKPKAPASP